MPFPSRTIIPGEIYDLKTTIKISGNFLQDIYSRKSTELQQEQPESAFELKPSSARWKLLLEGGADTAGHPPPAHSPGGWLFPSEL